MKTKATLTLCFIATTTFLLLIQRNPDNDLTLIFIATAIATLVTIPFIILYCRSAETHTLRFMSNPTLKNAFRVLLPSNFKKSKN